MYQTVFLLLSSIIIISCNTPKRNDTVQLPYYNEPTFTPLFLKDTAQINDSVTHTIADFSFLDEDSAVVDQTIFNNKIHVANFIFTSCGSICPVMTRNLKMVSDSLQNDSGVVFLSYSVTPWIDKPYVLKRFKNNYHITNNNWHLLTGPKAAIYSLARTSYFAEEDIGFTKDSSEFLHTEHILLIDKNKRIRGIYNGTLQVEMQNLITDIKALKQSTE